MKTYFLAVDDDRLLCESVSSDPEEKRRTLGAFRPGLDGNYYKEVIVGFVGNDELEYTLGMPRWWEWCKDSIKRGETLMDEEFSFDPDKVRIVTTMLDLSETRKIADAAIKTPDGKIWSVPRPGRHDSVIFKIYEATGKSVGGETQGFVDENGGFLNRDEAEIVARAAGQLEGPIIGGELTSEDLWRSWRCGYDVNEKKVIGGCGNIYERPRRKKERRLHRRVNRCRTITCPSCGQKDALHPRLKS